MSSPDASREEACCSSTVLLAFSRSDAVVRFLLLLLPEDGEDMFVASVKESLRYTMRKEHCARRSARQRIDRN